MLLRANAADNPEIEPYSLSVNGNGCLGLELYHFSDAPNAVIVYIPGYLAPSKTNRKMDSVMAAAEEQGLSVARFSYFGQETEQNPTYESLDIYWQCARAVTARVANLGKPVIFVADSMGCLFAMKLMEEYKEQTKGGIWVSPVPAFMAAPVMQEGQIVREAGHGWNRFMRKGSLDFGVEAVHKFGGDLRYHIAYLDQYRTIGGFDNIPSRLDQPVVILTSDKDGFVPPTHLKEMVRRTNAAVHFVAGADHRMTDDASIEMLGAILRTSIPAMLQGYPHP